MKRFVVSVLVGFILLTFGAAFAHVSPDSASYLSPSHPLYGYASEKLKSTLQEYYDVFDISIRVDEIIETDESVEYEIMIHYQYRLKAQDACELPFLRGMFEEMSRCETPAPRAQEFYRARREEINRHYIGKRHDANDDCLIVVPVIDGVQIYSLANMFSCMNFGDFREIAPMESMIPQSFEESRLEGAFFVGQLCSAPEAQTLMPRVNVNYDGWAARYYSSQWTDACGACHCGTPPCGDSVYNTYYTRYHNEDCANFVSQSLLAGGIPATETWSRDTLAWINVQALSNYLTGQNLFRRTTYRPFVTVGSVICWPTHVALVSYSDGVTIRFNAHTNDRLNRELENNQPVSFLVPITELPYSTPMPGYFSLSLW